MEILRTFVQGLAGAAVAAVVLMGAAAGGLAMQHWRGMTQADVAGGALAQSAPCDAAAIALALATDDQSATAAASPCAISDRATVGFANEPVPGAD